MSFNSESESQSRTNGLNPDSDSHITAFSHVVYTLPIVYDLRTQKLKLFAVLDLGMGALAPAPGGTYAFPQGVRRPIVKKDVRWLNKILGITITFVTFLYENWPYSWTT